MNIINLGVIHIIKNIMEWIPTGYSNCLTEWIVSGGFFSFFPLFSPQQRLRSKGLQHHALTKGGRSQLMCLVHSPTPATPVETAYSPLHHQQPQVIRGLWTLNINHLFLRRNQSWGLVEWPWSFFANDFQETSNPNPLGIQSPREAGRLLRPNHIRMGLEWIAPLDIVRNHSLMVQNIRSGCEIEILHHQKHGRKPINNFW